MKKSIRGYNLNNIVFRNDFFTVYEAEHAVLHGQRLRITLINEAFAKDPKIVSAFSQSIFRLSFAEHEFLVKNIDMIEEDGNLAILSEYAEYSDFENYLYTTNLDEKIQIIKQVFELIKYLHSRNIFVTDLRPQNLLITSEKKVKLSNLGLINIILNYSDQSILEGLEKQLRFTAPEICNFTATPNIRSEMYTLGCFAEYVFKDYLSGDYRTESFKVKQLSDILKVSKAIVPESRFTRVQDFEQKLLNCFDNIDDSVLVNYKNTFGNSEDYKQVIVNDDNDIEIGGVVPPEFEEIVETPKPIVEEKVNSEPKEQKKSSNMNYYEILEEIETAKAEKEKQKQQNISSKPRTSHTVFSDSKSVKRSHVNHTPGKGNSNASAYNKPPTANRTNQQRQYTSNSRQNFKPHQKVSTVNVLILGIIGMFFSLALPFIGFVLSIVGLSQIPKNSRKARLQGRALTKEEKTPQKIGTFLCILAFLISSIRMLVWFVKLAT